MLYGSSEISAIFAAKSLAPVDQAKRSIVQQIISPIFANVGRRASEEVMWCNLSNINAYQSYYMLWKFGT